MPKRRVSVDAPPLKSHSDEEWTLSTLGMRMAFESFTKGRNEPNPIVLGCHSLLRTWTIRYTEWEQNDIVWIHSTQCYGNSLRRSVWIQAWTFLLRSPVRECWLSYVIMRKGKRTKTTFQKDTFCINSKCDIYSVTGRMPPLEWVYRVISLLSGLRYLIME